MRSRKFQGFHISRLRCVSWDRRIPDAASMLAASSMYLRPSSTPHESWPECTLARAAPMPLAASIPSLREARCWEMSRVGTCPARPPYPQVCTCKISSISAPATAAAKSSLSPGIKSRAASIPLYPWDLSIARREDQPAGSALPNSSTPHVERTSLRGGAPSRPAAQATPLGSARRGGVRGSGRAVAGEGLRGSCGGLAPFVLGERKRAHRGSRGQEASGAASGGITGK
mmetsp:Transcript_64031/g.202573  ORF Transcript_64031/g.202573 Transcript_64031/m.202573 type:complete len:229 (-) Transcript_64031:68-754(-)